MKNALLIQVKERKLEMGTKKKTKRVQTLFFLVMRMRRIQRAYLISIRKGKEWGDNP